MVTQVVPPLMLYSKFAPNGAVSAIVPVGTAHVGWVKFAVGVAGGVGVKLIITSSLRRDVQLFALVTVKVYVVDAARLITV